VCYKFNDATNCYRFSEFKTSFKTNVVKINDQLIKNFNNNFIETSSEEIILNENENRSLTLTNEFEYLSIDNSMNQVRLKY
jgi:hypothetical protein